MICCSMSVRAKPLNRADWFDDVMPHETRGLFGNDGEGPERFTADTWVVRDICDREPWPFETANSISSSAPMSSRTSGTRFSSPSELQRVAKDGYIEVPSRVEEQSWGVQGDWVGWAHHHWIIELNGGRLDFLFKPHISTPVEEFFLPHEFHQTLTDEHRVELLWWSGKIDRRSPSLRAGLSSMPGPAQFVNRRLEESGSGRAAGGETKRLARPMTAPA